MEEIINQKSSNYFIRLFRGEISLPMTYWVWFFFINFIILTTSSFYFNNLPVELSTNQRYISIFIAIFSIFYSIYILIAVWRSATNHDGSKFWANVAKIIVIFNFINLSMESYNFTKNFTDETYALENSIKQLEKKTPIKISEDVYITKAAIDEKNIYYTYELQNFGNEKFSQTNKNLLKDDVTKATCNDIKSSNLLKQNYKFYYYYTTKKNIKIAEIKVTNEDCIQSNRDENILREILKQQS
ncbi:hypothetical protein [Arcobacter sp. LA11]|uniref:hypothetical protein n=1 Tax=Arcobacter sp. LA11 TaxID=1898176 RepID=UPI000934B8AD|nr:hypothetical protein [Arcobacter sp. LA11]